MAITVTKKEDGTYEIIGLLPNTVTWNKAGIEHRRITYPQQLAGFTKQLEDFTIYKANFDEVLKQIDAIEAPPEQ